MSKNQKKNFYEKSLDLDFEFDEAMEKSQINTLLFDEIAQVDKRYIEEDFLDQGGMKKIYCVQDVQLARPVAFARLYDEEEENVERFFKEARLMASLEHPAIPPVYDIGVDESGRAYFVMKLIQGENLSKVLEKNKLDLNQKLDVFLRVCDALAYAHANQVIHLDIKPANIQLGAYGEVMLCDWGLAKILDSGDEPLNQRLNPTLYNDVTLDGVVKGSPGYLAPEQVDNKLGKKDERTDIYALGAVLYFLLSGENAVQIKNIRKSLEDTLKNNIRDLRDLPSVPNGLAAVAMKALECKPQDRYASVTELQCEIRKWSQGFATRAEDANFLKSLKLLMQRHKLITLLLGSFSIAIALFIVNISQKEKQAQEALQLYKEQEKKTIEVSKEASPQWVHYAHRAEAKFDFELALKHVDVALDRDPNNSVAWSVKARLHYFKQEFNQALAAYEKSEAADKREAIMAFSEKYAEKPDAEKMSLSDLLDWLIESKSISHAYKIIGYSETYIEELSERMKLADVLLRKTNASVKNWHYKFDSQEASLDFSSMPPLYSLSAIRNLPIKKLNLSGTSVVEPIDLMRLPLEELDISSGKMNDIGRIISIPTLKRLILSESQFRGHSSPRTSLEFVRVKP
jgi:eukaryotic-like serine/threonine-protein kinase